MRNISLRHIDVEEARRNASSYKHNIIRQISDVMVDTDLKNILWDEVIEAYFFHERSGLHFYRSDEGLVCIKAEEPEEAEHIVTHTYNFANILQREDKRILEVREYLDFDEDGQCFVSYTRPVDIRREDKV